MIYKQNLFYWSCVTLLFLTVLKSVCTSGSFNHVKQIVKGSIEQSVNGGYPISASWFKDRFTTKEWDDTLEEFKSIGGDTVLLRAPPLLLRTKEAILMDPAYAFCRSHKSLSGLDGPDCITEAEQELKQFKIRGFATYQYEEGFSEKIALCPQYDRKINSSRLYYRLVIPLNSSESDPCPIPDWSLVVVVLTTFAGTDPHQLLAYRAARKNMTVFFGLPSAGDLPPDVLTAYYGFIFRILQEHKVRYSSLSEGRNGTRLWDSIAGYYSSDETSLGAVGKHGTVRSTYIKLYSTLGNLVHQQGKTLAVSPSISLSQSHSGYTVEENVRGFGYLGSTGIIDIIAVQDGRGRGLSSYHWQTETNSTIQDVDPVLNRIIRFLDPSLPENVTFREQFSGSNYELFRSLRKVRDTVVADGTHFEFWLNIQAFEYLRDDPCLPIDPAGSGMAELVDRTTKTHLDKALTVVGAQPQKISAFAWDPDFTCSSKNGSEGLKQDIKGDGKRPILADCKWHSPQNMSIVINGFNLLGLTQSYKVNYPRVQGDRQNVSLYGYYFETDYGAQNDRANSLVYIQMFDVMEPQFIAPHGNVTVWAEQAYHPCVFEY